MYPTFWEKTTESLISIILGQYLPATIPSEAKFATPNPPSKKTSMSSVVYSIPHECKRPYIGETRRAVSTRVNEHPENVQHGEVTKSKHAEHSWDNNHRLKIDKFPVI